MLPAVTHTEIAAMEERRFPALTPLQEAFVHNYVANGGNGTRAAKGAGYAKGSAHVEASKLLRKQAIIEAIGQLTMHRLAMLAPAALGRVARLSESAKSEYVQLEASKDLLSRVGLEAPKRVAVSGGVTINVDLS